jgi:probable phosphoglycerate mutase
MSTRLCIVRHGETSWNAEHRIQGQLDALLSETGHAQAQALARALANEDFAAVYSSDLSRARATVAPYALLKKIEVIPDETLRERHYGIFQTHTYAEVQVKYPEDYARFDRRDPAYDFRTGESLSSFSIRSIKAVQDIATRHAGQSLLIVTHGGVLDHLYRHINGLDLSSPRDFRIPNCGINRVELDGTRWRIHTWADTAHLKNALDDLPQ